MAKVYCLQEVNCQKTTEKFVWNFNEKNSILLFKSTYKPKIGENISIGTKEMDPAQNGVESYLAAWHPEEW